MCGNFEQSFFEETGQSEISSAGQTAAVAIA
jgi:hypothetical protein